MARRVSASTPDALAALAAAAAVAEERRAVEARYIAAVVAAAEAGVTYAEIGRAVGIVGESVRSLVERHG